MRFVWFWTFWHWSTESFRTGALLRGPVHGIGGHWDEWFRHEASADDRRAIDAAGASGLEQRRFVVWLVRHWAPEADWRGSHPPPRFVLGELAQLPPFDRWPAFAKYRTSYGVPGLSAVVLAEESAGEAADVRVVQAVALPADADVAAAAVVPEGFEADGADLNPARRAAMSLVGGNGLLILLALWIASGRRPYPRWVAAVLTLGWLSVGGLIVLLLAGPEPGERLLALSATLVALWAALALTAVGVAGSLSFRAWRAGRHLRALLERSQVRLRMDGGLRLAGGSAGLPFCLSTLLSAQRANQRANPRAVPGSWLWQRFFRALRADAASWAATGALTTAGRVEPVVLEPKLRACLRHPGIEHVLTPWQRGATQSAIDRVADALPPKAAAGQSGPMPSLAPGTRLGFASPRRRLRAHRCRHVAQAVMAVGDFTSARQMAANALALAVTVVVLVALPDLRSVLWPPPAPVVVAPASPWPHQLWVSVDTRHPDDFSVVFESEFWSNRRAAISTHGAGVPARAEIRLNRLARQAARDAEDGTVWIERRRHFLNREFAPGERVGRFTLAYLNRLSHE